MGILNIIKLSILMVTILNCYGETTDRQLQNIAKQLARQLIQQQLYVEERTRSEGDSGVKQVSLRRIMIPFKKN